VIGRAPLALAAYQACTRLLKKGQVKRVSGRVGPLVGYFLACPFCGFSASYLHEKHVFVEGEPAPGTKFPRPLLRMENPATCFSCRGLISVEGGELVTRVP
jgi:hypothetical protein